MITFNTNQVEILKQQMSDKGWAFEETSSERHGGVVFTRSSGMEHKEFYTWGAVAEYLWPNITLLLEAKN